MLILEFLKALQIALTILLVAAIAMALLMIASYLKEEMEELEHNAAAMALLSWFQRSIDALKKTMMIDEFPPLYNFQPVLIDIGSWLDSMAQWRTVFVKPKHIPRHAAASQGNFFEDGLGYFARGFDRNGSLLEKRAPRHTSGQVIVIDKSYLETVGELAFPLG